ncbi:HET-domain-containing protein, partial [Zopfia rhizophila CBS 207.26]
IDIELWSVLEAPGSCGYAALSYCWGKADVVTCTLANVELLERPFALQDAQLPQTIQDAIKVAAAMGIRYLWVDAICIIQDDERMLQSQIPNMARIYAQAVVTIIAANGDQANSGLCGIQPESRNVRCGLVSLPNLNLTTHPDDYAPRTRRSKWGFRAWTMQEELCSSRRLYFEANRVAWSCQSALWTEEAAREVGGISALPSTEILGTEPYPRLSNTPQDQVEMYRTQVEDYSSRQLTYPSDSLNAIIGILNILFADSEDQMFWGHPEKWFSRSLEWTLPFPATRHFGKNRAMGVDGFVVDIPFPSWSWSAW